MDPFKIVQFDIRGTRPENKITGEKMLIKDKTCPWLIPNGSPFFAEPGLFTLYDERGAEMTLNRDYWLEEAFIPFCEISGRNVCCFIRLSESIRQNNAFVTGDYQTIGAWFVPRNNLDEWLEKMREGKIPIEWEKVFGVPPTLPPEYHLHKADAEIGDWYELTFFLDTMANIYRSRDPELEDQSEVVINEAFTKLKSFKDAQMRRLVEHDKNYNAPHLQTKTNLNLGNLDNFATATPEQDKAGTADNLFSTTLGVKELVRGYTPDTSASMRSGIIAISRFGGTDYIPPGISGSFEGLGGVTPDCAAVLELNDNLVFIRAHYDGRTEGLYYTVVRNHLSLNPDVSFTGYKYQPPSLTAIGFVPNRVFTGSGRNIIMVTRDGTNQVYAALTNGTLDPSAHVFVKCNIDLAIQDLGTSVRLTEWSQIHTLGNWVYLFVTAITEGQWGGWGHSRTRAYRAPLSAIKNGQPLTFSRVKVSLTNVPGALQSNVDYIEFTPAPPDGEFSTYGPITFAPYKAKKGVKGSQRRPLMFFSETSDIGPQYCSMHYFGMMFFTGNINGVDRVTGVYIDCSYDFNPETATFVVVKQPPVQTVDLSKIISKNSTASVHYAGISDVFFNISDHSSHLLLENKVIVGMSRLGLRVSFPGLFSRLQFNKNPNVTASGMLRDYMHADNANFSGVGVWETPSYPIKNGGRVSAVGYELTGEYFWADSTVDHNRSFFYRKVSGEYAARPGITNSNYPTLLARPISAEVYENRLDRNTSLISVTGSAAFLTAEGIEMGNSCFSVMGMNHFDDLASGVESDTTCPREFTFKAPKGNGIVLSCPRTFSRVMDAGDQTFTLKGESHWGVKRNVMDKLIQLIPDTLREKWAVELMVINPVSGKGFSRMNYVLALVHTRDIERGRYVVKSKLLACAPVIGNPVSGVYPIDDLTILDQTAFITTVNNSGAGDEWSDTEADVVACPQVSLYVDEATNTLSGRISSLYNVRGDALGFNKAVLTFSLNKSTHKFSSVTPFNNGEGMSAAWCVQNHAIPNAGLITQQQGYVFEDTGGAGYVGKIGTNTYLIGSCYPEVGWTIFFQEEVEMMINGTVYKMPGGSIDLRNVSSNPRNKTFYIYATVEESEGRYIVSDVKLRRSSELLHVATAVTNTNQIASITRQKVFTIGEFLLSYTRTGGIIPVSSGLPQDEGTFSFLKASELLP